MATEKYFTRSCLYVVVPFIYVVVSCVVVVVVVMAGNGIKAFIRMNQKICYQYYCGKVKLLYHNLLTSKEKSFFRYETLNVYFFILSFSLKFAHLFEDFFPKFIKNVYVIVPF